MKFKIKIVAPLLICLFLSACSTWDKLDKTERGAVIGTSSGAILGGAVGGGTGAVIGGAAGGVTGGVIGHEVEEHDDRRRRRY